MNATLHMATTDAEREAIYRLRHNEPERDVQNPIRQFS